MNLETLKNTLLVMLVIMLVYVLYKRLIHILKKDQVMTRYPALANALKWSEDNRQATIEVTLQEKMYLIVDIFDQHGNRVLHLAEGEYVAGPQHFAFSRSALVPGRYYYKVTSPWEQASQYFEV
ncbi:MAG: hypothetical protein ACK5XV_13260 [Flavobacteriales bacterium]|jgi:hypothetical protein